MYFLIPPNDLKVLLTVRYFGFLKLFVKSEMTPEKCCNAYFFFLSFWEVKGRRGESARIADIQGISWNSPQDTNCAYSTGAALGHKISKTCRHPSIPHCLKITHCNFFLIPWRLKGKEMEYQSFCWQRRELRLFQWGSNTVCYLILNVTNLIQSDFESINCDARPKVFSNLILSVHLVASG